MRYFKVFFVCGGVIDVNFYLQKEFLGGNTCVGVRTELIPVTELHEDRDFAFWNLLLF